MTRYRLNFPGFWTPPRYAHFKCWIFNATLILMGSWYLILVTSVLKIQKYSRAESKWAKIHMRLIQGWVSLETEVEQEYLRAPLCRYAAKSFSLSVRLHMKRKFPMSSPDVDSPCPGHTVWHTSEYTFTSRWDEEGIGLHPWQDTYPLQDTHIHSHSHQEQNGKNPRMRGRVRKIQHRTQKSNPESFLYAATLLNIEPLSHPGSVISQDSVVHKKRKRG